MTGVEATMDLLQKLNALSAENALLKQQLSDARKNVVATVDEYARDRVHKLNSVASVQEDRINCAMEQIKDLRAGCDTLRRWESLRFYLLIVMFVAHLALWHLR